MNKKNILYIIPRFTTAGAETLVLQYARHAKDAGHDVAVVSVVGGGELEAAFQELDISIHVAAKKDLFSSWRQFLRIKKYVQQFSPDIIHTHVFSADVVGFLLCKYTKVWISTQHNIGKEFSFIRKKVLSFCLSYADAVTAVSDAVYNFCRKDLRLKNSSIEVIKNGVDTSKWTKIKGDILKQDTIQLASIGRLEPQKNHVFLLRSLANIDRSILWHMHIYGDGSLKKDLQTLAQQLHISEYITWHGVERDMEKVYRSVDVVVQPSRWEGLSLVVMEAMAAGRLVVASHAAGAELIHDKKDGLLVDIEDDTAIATLMDSIDSHRTDMQKIAKQAQVHAKKTFSLDTHLSVIEALYEKNI